MALHLRSFALALLLYTILELVAPAVDDKEAEQDGLHADVMMARDVEEGHCASADSQGCDALSLRQLRVRRASGGQKRAQAESEDLGRWNPYAASPWPQAPSQPSAGAAGWWKPFDPYNPYSHAGGSPGQPYNPYTPYSPAGGSHGQPHAQGCKKNATWGGPQQAHEQAGGEAQLWGGPAVAWSRAKFQHTAFPSASPQTVMSYAGPGSDVPSNLWGIWWMDQYGQSSVATDDDYPYSMVGTPEILASFGESRFGDGTGTRYDKCTRCVTPIPAYGGSHWTAEDNTNGKKILRAHHRARNTLSFCYADESLQTVQIYQKMRTKHASIGALEIGPSLARRLGYEKAGHGYSWAPQRIINMTMVKKPWGWDRVTTLADFANSLTPDEQERINNLWSPFRWIFEKLQKTQKSIVSHYPVLQIIDGYGRPTKWYPEYMKFMGTRKNGQSMIVSLPAAGQL